MSRRYAALCCAESLCWSHGLAKLYVMNRFSVLLLWGLLDSGIQRSPRHLVSLEYSSLSDKCDEFLPANKTQGWQVARIERCSD